MGIITIEDFHRDYMTFDQERFPDIGIYYLFKHHDRGVCIEGSLDIQRLVEEKEKSIIFNNKYAFAGEHKLLEILEDKKVQGIRTQPVQGLSLKKLVEITANQHFDEFLKRHPWLTNLEIKKYIVRYSNFFDLVQQIDSEN